MRALRDPRGASMRRYVLRADVACNVNARNNKKNVNTISAGIKQRQRRIAQNGL